LAISFSIIGLFDLTLFALQSSHWHGELFLPVFSNFVKEIQCLLFLKAGIDVKIKVLSISTLNPFGFSWKAFMPDRILLLQNR